jgi:hypothetical protein
MMVSQEDVLKAIGSVLAKCESNKEIAGDSTIVWEIAALKQAQTEVEKAWPIPEAVKSSLMIGPFAAKNIDDWNPELAEMLMVIQSVLHNDGVGIERLIKITG